MKYANKPKGVSQKRLRMAERRRQRHAKRRSAKQSHGVKTHWTAEDIEAQAKERQRKREVKEQKHFDLMKSFITKTKRLTYRRHQSR
jgi:hypothetical protein